VDLLDDHHGEIRCPKNVDVVLGATLKLATSMGNRLRSVSSAENPLNLPHMSAPVYLLPQFTGTFERHHSASRQYGILPSSWIPPLPFSLFLYTKLSEARNQDIVTGF
jgi:hypothetical protein